MYQTMHDIITVATIAVNVSSAVAILFCRVLKGQEQFEKCYAEPWVDDYHF